MGVIGGSLGYELLKNISPGEPTTLDGSAYASKSKLETLLGSSFWRDIDGKVVIDFGCGLGDGVGALRVIAPRNIHAVARVYNDRRTAGDGTFSQFIPSQPGSQNRTSGALQMLANAQAATGAGYRTNIGWFNSGPNQVTVTWTARNTSGTILATATQVIAPRASGQTGLNEMFPGIGLPPMDSLYVRFTTTGGPLYVYASVVDNVNGDGIFIPAQ